MTEPRTRSSGRTRTLVALSLFCVVVVNAAAVVPSAGAASSSAKSLLARALANAKTSHWVRETVEIEEEGVPVERSHDVIGANEGEQSSILSNGGTSQLIAFDSKKTLYVRADAAGLTTTYSMTSVNAAIFANEWLELTPATSIYASVAYATTLASDFSQVRFAGRIRLGGVGTVDGKRVRVMAGVVPAVNGAPRFNGTLDVTATGRLLPVRFHEARGSTVITVTWSGWGHGTTLTPPSSAVAYPSA